MALSRTNRGNATLAEAANTNPSVTSASFSPAGGSLLIAMGGQYANGVGNSVHTLSSTFTGQGAWTVRSIIRDDGFTNQMSSYIAWSVCGASPGSGTITVAGKTGTITGGMFGEFIEVTGQAASPQAQQVTASGTGASLATNFAAAPDANSYAFFACTDSAAPTVPSGTTALASFGVSAGGWTAKNAEKLGSAATNNSWTTASFCNTGVAIEVAVASNPLLFVVRGPRQAVKRAGFY